MDEQTLKNVIDIINSLSSKECLVYQNTTWYLLVDWVKNCLNLDKNNLLFKNFILNEFDVFTNDQSSNQFSTNFTSNKLAKFLLILMDTKIEAIYNPILSSIADRIASCNKYAYRSSGVIEKTIFTFNNMVNLVRGKNLIFILKIFKFILFLGSSFANRQSSSYTLIESLYNQVIEDILDYILRKSDFNSEQVS